MWLGLFSSTAVRICSDDDGCNPQGCISGVLICVDQILDCNDRDIYGWMVLQIMNDWIEVVYKTNDM